MSDFFEIIPVTNQYGIHIITNVKPLDREVTPNYTLTLVARDTQDPSMSSTAQLIINIMDMNDNPPIIAHESGRISIPEDKQINDEVCL